MLKKALMTMIVILVCVSSTSSNYANLHLLDEQHHPMESGSAVRVQITPPTYIMSADEVVTFSAKLYDSVNSEVAGDIIGHQPMVLLPLKVPSTRGTLE